MSGVRRCVRWVASLVLGLAGGGMLCAQTRLYVIQSDGKYYPVVKVQRHRPCIWKDDQLIAVTGARYALAKADEFLPANVVFHDVEARTTSLHLVDVGAQINSQFEFIARIESPFPLSDVFVVLDLEGADMGKRIFVHEIGDLKPWVPQPLELIVPSGRYLGSGQYRLHVFAGGAEVFHSEQPDGFRDQMLDRMIASRLAGVRDAGASLFFAPAPQYPPALRASGLKGRATVTLHVTARGTVRDPAVASATDPVFGEAAVAAVRAWRFLPRVRDGYPVDCEVSIPFQFDPPP